MIPAEIYWTANPVLVQIPEFTLRTLLWIVGGLILLSGLFSKLKGEKLTRDWLWTLIGYGLVATIIGLRAGDVVMAPEIRWYSLMFVIGFTVGYWIVARMFRHEGAPEQWLGILLIWLGIGTIVGARLGHVFFYEWDIYSKDPISILYIWEGGLASHGGTIGIIICILLFSHFTTKRSPLWTFDRIVTPIALTGALIRMGNLFNSEIYGHATDLPWGFHFITNMHAWMNGAEPVFGPACHPTQIYEALCYLALFGLLMWMYWRRNAEERPGLMFGTFLTVLFTCRFFIEFIKNDQVEFEQNMVLNMGQWLSVPFIIAGIYFIVRAFRRPPVHIDFPNRFADEDDNKKEGAKQ